MASAGWINREMPCGKNYSGKDGYVHRVSELHARTCDICVHIKSHKINVKSKHAVNGETSKEIAGVGIERYAQLGVPSLRIKPIFEIEH